MASRSNRARRASGLSVATSISSACSAACEVLMSSVPSPASCCVASRAGSTVLIVFKSTVTRGTAPGLGVDFPAAAAGPAPKPAGADTSGGTTNCPRTAISIGPCSCTASFTNVKAPSPLRFPGTAPAGLCPPALALPGTRPRPDPGWAPTARICGAGLPYSHQPCLNPGGGPGTDVHGSPDLHCTTTSGGQIFRKSARLEPTPPQSPRLVHPGGNSCPLSVF